METEKRLIRADVTVDAFTKWLTSTYDGRMPVDIVNEIPTVDAVEVVHGHWDEGVYHGYCCCSNCRNVYILQEWLTDGKWNYCPNCGAKMDGG